MSVPFLLDTDVVSNLRKKKPHPRLVSWLQATPRDLVFMAAATVTELQHGASKVVDPATAHAVQGWLDRLLKDGHPQVLSFDARAAALLGRMWASPSLANFLANDPRSRKIKTGTDLAIAAAAITGGMVVVTGNVGDFLRIHAEFPLRGVFNPFDGVWGLAP
jgi:predicted nucleic acid-binding protein